MKIGKENKEYIVEHPEIPDSPGSMPNTPAPSEAPAADPAPRAPEPVPAVP